MLQVRTKNQMMKHYALCGLVLTVKYMERQELHRAIDTLSDESVMAMLDLARSLCNGISP